ncbi:MAG: response regulator [Limisphaerales bacterium]
MSKLILLVAHQADVVQSIPITLRLAGHRVMLAGTGLDAIKRAGSLMPDLILADAALPDMDGPTVIDILRRLPSTGTVPSMLIHPRLQGSADQAGEGKYGRLNSSALLQHVAAALAACGAKDQEPLSAYSREQMDSAQNPSSPV